MVQELSAAVLQQAQQVATLTQQLLATAQHCTPQTAALLAGLPLRHRTTVSSLLLSTAPLSMTGGWRAFVWRSGSRRGLWRVTRGVRGTPV